MVFLWRKCAKPKILLWIPTLLCILYCEWFAYMTYTWPELSCGLVRNFHKILFVADPQILGENTESLFARTDCDRFLKKTFHKALNYVQPDLIVFLGDLMDEGSIANNEQYERYYRRFRDIFQLDTIPPNQKIYLPGDNDIGGENEEVTELKVRRFKEHFPSPSVVSYKNMTFFHINSLTKEIPHVKVENDTSLRILISHIPLLGIWSTFGTEAIEQLKPLFVFTAHDHKMIHFVTAINSSRREIVETLEGKNGWRFNLFMSRRTNEIVVPTSSYRMGTYDVGYGVALLSVKGDALCYYMLWSPKRLLHLLLYLILFSSMSLCGFIYLLITAWQRRLRKSSAKYTRLFTDF